MISPYYQDEFVTLYCGDMRQFISDLPAADVIITDPPYGETSLYWDFWPSGWPNLVASAADQMWCFGSLRMFLSRSQEFSGWKLAQDVVWEKHNGSNPSNDRFRRIHEHVLHFYRGSWSDVYKCPQFDREATSRTVRRKSRPKHWGQISDSMYTSVDGGPKMMGSIIYARSCHGHAVNETQKPEAIIAPLIEYSTKPGDLIIDPFAGSGTTLAVARKLGRRAIGIELRDEQCAEIVNRLAQLDMPL